MGGKGIVIGARLKEYLYMQSEKGRVGVRSRMCVNTKKYGNMPAGPGGGTRI